MNPAAHAVTRLDLQNFRNYRALSLELPPSPVVLIGHNGAGKTNILEALSLFAPGRGLRSARLSEMDRLQGGSAPWVVAAQLRRGNETLHLGTGRESPSPHRGEVRWGAELANQDDQKQPPSQPPPRGGRSAPEKRLIKLNGEKLRAQSALTKTVCIQWLTPAMDQIFTEGGTARRKLLDRLTYSFDPEHATRVSAYEQAMRERNRLLADHGMQADTYWLDVLERQMAEHAVAMSLARLEALTHIAQAMQEEIAGFPTAAMALQGTVENALAQGQSALEAEQGLAERLAQLRSHDARSGRASEGAHRSVWQVTHQQKNMEAAFCSTGEQKALLLALVIAAARARSRWCSLPPILLLDEVIAHLDRDRRLRLFELISAAGIQAWMTGTDAADFDGMRDRASVLNVENATITRA